MIVLRRLKELRIPIGAAGAVFAEGAHESYTVVKGIPEDAQILRCDIDQPAGELIFTLYSESFTKLLDGQNPPQICVTCVKP